MTPDTPWYAGVDPYPLGGLCPGGLPDSRLGGSGKLGVAHGTARPRDVYALPAGCLAVMFLLSTMSNS